MASVQLSRRVGKVVGYPPLCEIGDLQRREFHEALLEADTFEDLPGKWQAAILKAEQSRPKLRVVSGDLASIHRCAGPICCGRVDRGRLGRLGCWSGRRSASGSGFGGLSAGFAAAVVGRVPGRVGVVVVDGSVVVRRRPGAPGSWRARG